MNELTDRQEEYLFVLASFSGEGCRLTDVADRLGVRLPTALRAVDVLEEYGYVSRPTEDKLIHVTEAGKRYISDRLQVVSELSEWLGKKAAMSSYDAMCEARKMAMSLRPDTVAAVLGKDPKSAADELASVPEGIYSLDVSLNKKDTHVPSHGDGGIRKPARLIRGKNGGAFLVRATDMGRRRGGASLTGRLERLWFQKDDGWQECKAEEKGLFQIPFDRVRLMRHDGKRIAVIRVKVRVNVGLFHMPESEADLEFDMSDVPGISV